MWLVFGVAIGGNLRSTKNLSHQCVNGGEWLSANKNPKTIIITLNRPSRIKSRNRDWCLWWVAILRNLAKKETAEIAGLRTADKNQTSQ